MNQTTTNGSNENDLDSSLNELSENYNIDKEENEQKPKKKSSYKSKKVREEEEQKAKEEFSNTVSGVGSIFGSIIIERISPDKPLTKEEGDRLDSAFDAVIIKHSDKFGNYKEESALALVLVSVFIPRLNLFVPKTGTVESEKK